MRFFRKVSIKYKQMILVWLCLCGGLFLGAFGLAAFQVIAPAPPFRGSQEVVAEVIGASILLFLLAGTFLATVFLSNWLQGLISGPILGLVRGARMVAQKK